MCTGYTERTRHGRAVALGDPRNTTAPKIIDRRGCWDNIAVTKVGGQGLGVIRGLTCKWEPPADRDGPIGFARLGVMQALSRHVERVFDPSRQEMKWGRRKLARDQ
jgi:hypothetical protein